MFSARRFASRTTLVASSIATALATLIAFHQRPFNGPLYYPWPFARLPIGPTLLVAAMIGAHLAIISAALAKVRRFWLAITLVALGSLGLRLGIASALSDPFGLGNAAALVQDAHVGSFFTAAEMASTVEWRLSDYPTLMPQFPLHARHKAPAPMLFWTTMLRVAGGDRDAAARVGVVLVAILSAAAVPMAAVFARSAGVGDRVARHVAAITSLLPGAIVFFPLFDPAYLTWSLALLVTWCWAIVGPARRAIGFGIALALTFFIVFNVLPLGLYLAAIGVVVARRVQPDRWLARVASRAAIAIVAALIGVVLMRVVIGYDALATLRVAIDQQADMQRQFGDRLRPYPNTIGWDLYDAALGVGFAPAVLALAAIVGRRDRHGIARCGAATWVTVAVASLLPVETARVWCFLTPLIVLPAGIIIARATRSARVAFYVATALVLLSLASSLLFVTPAPVIGGV